MPRIVLLASAALLLALVTPRRAFGQDPSWTPPSREMPAMPSADDLDGSWVSAHRPWFDGTDRVTGVSPSSLRASGEAGRGGSTVQVARFTNGPLPAIVWSDRNGDGRADLIEIFRSGGVVAQLIDADYDGSANVMRIYDGAGNLVRQERM